MSGVFYFCRMRDYIIVGSGLAGIAFAETARKASKSIMIFGDNVHNSSIVAGGLYNPVILKRFSGLKDAGIQIVTLRKFYQSLRDDLGIDVEYPKPTLRKFHSVEEQNNWFVASDKPVMAPFLSTTFISRKYKGIDSPFGYGEVLETGYVDTASLLDQYKTYLKSVDSFRAETVDYARIEHHDHSVTYKDITARHIVFCEGFGIKVNPFFNYLPLQGTKGELLIIRAPLLDLDVILNTNVFILPIGNQLFKAGATYNWDDRTQLPTEAGREELIARIREILTCDFEVIDHLAGIRPTVKDRKPLVGTHPELSRMHVLNGLGTRGVMLGPASAEMLFNNIEQNQQLEWEYDIKRFESLRF
jgi:glycine oxidase